jgi:hypothetical protein
LGMRTREPRYVAHEQARRGIALDDGCEGTHTWRVAPRFAPYKAASGRDTCRLTRRGGLREGPPASVRPSGPVVAVLVPLGTHKGAPSFRKRRYIL